MNNHQKAAQETAAQTDTIIAAFKAKNEPEPEAPKTARINVAAIADSFTETVVERLDRLALTLQIDESRFIHKEREAIVDESDAHELIARLSLIAGEVQGILEAAAFVARTVRTLA